MFLQVAKIIVCIVVLLMTFALVAIESYPTIKRVCMHIVRKIKSWHYSYIAKVATNPPIAALTVGAVMILSATYSLLISVIGAFGIIPLLICYYPFHCIVEAIKINQRLLRASYSNSNGWSVEEDLDGDGNPNDSLKRMGIE